MSDQTSKASVDTLSALHAKLAETFVRQIERYTLKDEPVPPSLLAAIAKFLKDNDITADAAPGSPIGALASALGKDLPFNSH